MKRFLSNYEYILIRTFIPDLIHTYLGKMLNFNSLKSLS